MSVIAGASAQRARVLSPVPAWPVFLAVGLVAVVLYLTVVPQELVEGWYNTIAPVCAGVVIVETLRRRLRPIAAYLLIAAGLALTGLGDFAWTELLNAGLEPFPSHVDGLYLGGNACLVFGLWLRFGRARGAGAAVAAEAVILTTAAGLFLWQFAIQPVLGEESGDLFANAIAVAYPLTDLLLLGLVARFVLLPGRQPLPLWLTVVALAGLTASDIAYSTQLLGDGYVAGLIDGGWLAAYVLIATSVVHPAADQAPGATTAGSLTSRPRLLVLGMSLLVAPALILNEELGGEHEDVLLFAAGAAVLGLLVLLRFAMAVRALRGSLDERRILQVELEHQASHDSLTGLANRALFTARLRDAIEHERSVVVMFIDLDDFKAVNDSYGHEDGDRLLVEVANRIRGALRPGDLPVRIGGDEFAVLLEGTDSQGGEIVAARLLDVFRQPIDVGAHVVTARVSIGLASSRGTDAEGILRNADIAMYLAKEQGKDRYQAFDVRMHEDVLNRLHVRADLERAIERAEFEVYYQPIVDVPTRAIRATEALVRWQHPERGLLPPSEFIDVAETTGLIVRLGRWVLREALTMTRRWQDEFERPNLAVAVNVSARQFEHPGFVAEVAAALADTGMRPECLTLEITESSILDERSTMATLRELKRLGVRISVDDFGTGYSSLSYVGRLPVDELKIDRSFILALGSDSREGALAASVIQLGGTLDLVTVAEGIEEREQLELLCELGCDLGQGYYLARPMPAAQMAALFRETSSRDAQPASRSLPLVEPA